MAGIPIATVASIDSGGKGACNTPPLVLGKASSATGVAKVYAGKILVVKSSDTFKPAPGTTPKGDPCTSPRTLKGKSKCKVGKLPVGKKGDTLYAPTGITIAKASTAGVYVV